tara:strand:- start:90 stop:620 length:531 start_codon:yes stop_codon:yes gene_type:complete
MHKSKSYPLLDEEKVTPMRKSTSLCDLQESDYFFGDFFEGDGPLGIYFLENENGEIIVKKIIKNTVASETYGLYTYMVLIDVNNQDIRNKPFNKVMRLIKKSWDSENRIYLKFKKQIYPIISKILNDNNLIKFYDNFIELGAKDESDFEYVEYDDLIKMNMNRTDITNFKKIKPNI